MARGTNMELVQPTTNDEFCQSHRMYFGGEQGPRAVCYGGVSSVEEKK